MDLKGFKQWAADPVHSITAGNYTTDARVIRTGQFAGDLKPFDGKAASIVEAISGKYAEISVLEKELLKLVKGRQDKK